MCNKGGELESKQWSVSMSEHVCVQSHLVQHPHMGPDKALIQQQFWTKVALLRRPASLRFVAAVPISMCGGVVCTDAIEFAAPQGHRVS